MIDTQDSESENQLTENGGVVRAATVLALGNISSRILGLARETVKANLFGASGLLSAFEVAAYVPTSLFDLIIGGMVNSSLVPVFSDYAAPEKRHELWKILSTVLSVATAVLIIVVLLVQLFADQVAWLMGANNFEDAALTAVTVQLLRLVTPAVLFLGLASIITGALYALKRFTLPAFVGAVFNGTVVIVALAFPNRIESLAWGLLLGAFLQIILQLPALRDARLRWRFDWRNPTIRRILFLYAPIVAGLVINQLAIAFSINLATRTGDQSVSYMKFATTLYQFPLGLVVTALSIATLPTLSQQANQLTAFKQTLAQGIRLVITLILPATAGLLALATPIVALLFEHGQFTPDDTIQTALVLRVYLIGMPFAAVDQMLVFASYARKDTWRPALVGVISNVIYSITAVFLLTPLGLLSLMVADAVKHIAHTLMMIWLLQRQLGGLGGHGVVQTAVRAFIAAAATGIIAYTTMTFIQPLFPAASRPVNLLVVAISGALGLLTFLGLAFILNLQEIKMLRTLIRRKLKQS
ncbi:MAG: murein biosynthesis integral membrane protein MurJ [Chloroflexota bacterium]